MAEVNEAAAADPSMEEILASIRKIISDDNPAEEPVANGASADVLELTQMVQETAPAPQPAPPSPPPIAAAPVSVAPKADALMSAPAASTAASALSSLATTVEIERLASTPMTATSIGNGYRTLEDMVIELMRPLLKEWLDQNLPATVERLVQKEIERIARRS